jgi:hypothetical protein
MPTPRENRTAGLREQRQNEGAGQGRRRAAADDGEVRVQSLRRAGPLSAVGSGGVELPPGAGCEHGAERSARKFGNVMSRFGGPAGGSE